MKQAASKPVAILGTAGRVARSFEGETAALFEVVGRNTGNLAFQYATCQALADDYRLYPFAFDPALVAAECRAICLPSANFLYTGFDLGDLARRIEKANLPLFVIGLGAQAMRSIDEVVLKEGTVRLLKVMSERCRTILVRGDITARVLEKYGVKNFTVFGCPSNLISAKKDLGASILQRWKSHRDGIAFAPTFYSYNSDFELELLNIIGPRLTEIVAQDPLGAVAWARGDRGPSALDWAHGKSGFLSKLPADLQRSALARLTTYFSCEAWLEAYRGSDAVVASRIHGASLGWQAGRASLVVSYDLRTEELARTMGLPFIKSDQIDGAGFDRMFDEKVEASVADYDARRRLSAVLLMESLRGAELTPSDHLIGLAGQVAPEPGPAVREQRPAVWGFLEKYNRDRIGGWVASDGPEAPEVVIRLGSREIARVAGGVIRADLGEKAWGFEVEVPSEAITEQVMRVEAVFASNGQHLRNSPIVSSFAENDRRKVVIGKDGWLFLGDDTNQTMDQICGRRPLTPGETGVWREFFLLLEQTCRSIGVPAIYLVAPAKEVVAARFLPDELVLSENRAVRQLQRLVSELPLEWVKFLYPAEAMASQSAYPVYPKGDTHWTDYGAAVALRELYGAMRNNLDIQPNFDDTYEIEYRNTDLRSKLGGVCVEQMPVRRGPSSYKLVSDNEIINSGRIKQLESLGPVARRNLLLFHDSFGDWLIPRLAETFAKTKSLWTRNFDLSALNAFRPDMIVFERAERFLIQPPQVARI